MVYKNIIIIVMKEILVWSFDFEVKVAKAKFQFIKRILDSK